MYTSTQLMAQYNGATMADTYVWQTRQTTLNVHDSTVNQTGTNHWQLADNFTDGTDINGNALTSTDVEVVDGTVDTTTPGTYTVTYRYTDAANYAVTAVATITVVASKVAVEAHDTTVMQGQTWDAQDSFDQALDFDGQSVDFKDVTVTGADAVKPNVPGDYQVTYSYTDANGNVDSKTITVAVAKSAVAVNANDTTITQGEAWTAADSFEGATDADGNAVDFSDVTVTGADAVNNQVPGTYQVTYSYTDAYGNVAEKTITVTVAASQLGLDVKDVTVQQGSSWTAADSFLTATDENGQPVDFANVTVTGDDAVDTTTPGSYQVNYSYTDKFGNTVTKTATVTIVADNNTDNGDDGDPDEIDPGTDPDTSTSGNTDGNGTTNSSNNNGQADTIIDSTSSQTGTPMTPMTRRPPTSQGLPKSLSTTKTAADKANTLPQTDDQRARGAILLGAALLSLTTALAFFGKKHWTEK